MTEQEPFDELFGGGIADRFLQRAGLAGFGLAHQIDRLPDDRNVAGQLRRRGPRKLIAGRLRLMLSLRNTRRMLVFLVLALRHSSVALMARLARRIGLLGMLSLLVKGVRRALA